MAIAAGAVRGLRGAARREQTRLGGRDDAITIALGLWLLAGIFVDGWAHNSRNLVESFFTPWHAILYSGYAANSGWFCWILWRGRRAGRVGLAAIPRGYELGLAGVVLFGLGGGADMLWHLAFGVEVGLAALLSPSHLLLFAGGLLIVTSPLRSAWYTPGPAGDAPTLRAFLPALLSIVAAVSATSFMGMYYWAVTDTHHTTEATRSLAGRTLYFSQRLGLEGILLTNIVLLAPILLVLRRWTLPFGSIALLFTVNTILMNALDEFYAVETIGVALVAGLAADGLLRALRPDAARPGATRLFAALVPLIFRGLFFATAWVRRGIGWPPELWTGAIVLTVLSGLGLSLLTVPPARPAEGTPHA